MGVPMYSRSVALIEDEPSHVTLMDYHLNELGINVTSFTSGQLFLQGMSLVQQEFSLIIISDQLYDTPILPFVQELEQSKLTTVPVLVMTTGRQEQVLSDKCEVHYLHKPFAIHDFRQAIQGILQEPTLIVSS